MRQILKIAIAFTLAGLAGIALLVVCSDRVREEVAHLPERIAARFVAAEPGELLPVADEAGDRLVDLAGLSDGKIVWSSNRDGNHELHLLDLGTGVVSRLTDHPHVDYFSRFSPDGTRVVFLRSQREYVSGRDPDLWDVWIIDSDGRNERRIARNGFRPTWTVDGSAVLFSRGRNVFRVDVESGRETRVFRPSEGFPGNRPDGIHPYADGTRIGVMRRDRGSSIVFTDGSPTVSIDDMPSCQLTWYPQLEKLTWVRGSGNGGNAVMWSGPDGANASVLIDLPGARSHEYFPRLSPDGRWLVWAAAAEGHEHDRADYEVYLWEVGTPWEDAVRITHYTGNDQWPDIWTGP